jgi:hypothetical protein
MNNKMLIWFTFTVSVLSVWYIWRERTLKSKPLDEQKRLRKQMWFQIGALGVLSLLVFFLFGSDTKPRGRRHNRSFEDWPKCFDACPRGTVCASSGESPAEDVCLTNNEINLFGQFDSFSDWNDWYTNRAFPDQVDPFIQRNIRNWESRLQAYYSDPNRIISRHSYTD